MDQLKQNMILKEELSWKIKKDITYDKESFVDYLRKEKEIFDHPRSGRQKIIALIISIILGFLGLSSLLFSIEVISEVVFFKTFTTPEEFGSVPREVSAGLMISVGFATFLGIIFSIITILYSIFLITPNWSGYHDKMLFLFKRLENIGLIDNFIGFNETNGKGKFQLKKIPIDIDLEWIYPFIFDAFPPLLFELLLLSFLLPFLVTTTISSFFAFLNVEWVTLLFLGSLLVLILIGFEQSGLAIYRSWKKYSRVLGSMIYRQQEIIHSLILNKSDEMTIIRHQNNLTRLVSMSSFPIPQLIRVSAVIPLFGSLLGYVIAITAIT